MKTRLLTILIICTSFSLTYSQKKIFTAVEKGNIEALNKYIDEGNSLDVTYGYEIKLESGEKRTYKKNLMECALNFEQREALDLLIENKDKFKNYLEIVSKAFVSSISWGDMELVKKLLAEGADMNEICESCYQQNAMQIALNYEFYEIFNYLVEKGAEIDDYQNEFGYTLLMIAVIVENTEMVKLLINKGVDINLPDYEGWTPIMVATSNGNLDIFNLLHNNNASLEGLTQDGEDILYLAIMGNNIDIAKYLVDDAGMDVNTTNAFSITPIILAVANQSPEMVKFLIEKKAFLDNQNDDAETALSMAIQLKDTEISKMLIEAEADLWEIDYLKLAKKYIKDADFVAYLEKKIEGEE